MQLTVSRNFHLPSRIVFCEMMRSYPVIFTAVFPAFSQRFWSMPLGFSVIGA
uniref:Uncharacterized protein n=1 Tax=Arundo donax TaxID=35708 RepID=A0A0A9GX69_ARUDO